MLGCPKCLVNSSFSFFFNPVSHADLLHGLQISFHSKTPEETWEEIPQEASIYPNQPPPPPPSEA